MRRTLNEQINTFKKLTGLLLNEGPGEILARLMSKLSKSTLEDAAITAFEGLEKKGVITIDKASNSLKSVNWGSMADADLKLFFRSRTVRTMFEEAAKESGVNLTGSFASKYASPNLKKLLNGYKQAETEGIFDGATLLRKPPAATVPAATTTGAVPPPEVSTVLDKSMSAFVSNKLKISDIRKVSDDDIAKMTQLQQLKKNGEGVKLAELTTKTQKEITNIDIKIKKTELAEKQLDLEIKKNSASVDLKMKKTQLAHEKMTLHQARAQMIWKAKWYIIGILVIAFGWKKAVPYIERIFKGEPIMSGGGTTTTPTQTNPVPSTGNNNTGGTPPPPTPSKEKADW